MMNIAKLLARKQRLLELRRDEPGPAEEFELDRQLTEINDALDVIERAELPAPRSQQMVEPLLH